MNAVAPDPVHLLHDQFGRPTRLNANGEMVEIIDLQPPTATTVPVVYVPGWLAYAGCFKAHLISLAKCGFRVLAVESPLHGLSSESRRPFPTPQLRKALPIAYALEQLAIKRCDVVAYSEGSITAAILAKLKPGSVRNLVLLSPSGLWWGDTLLGAMLRTGIEFLNSIKNILWQLHDAEGRANGRTGILGALRCLREGPLDALRQALAVSSTFLGETIRKLQANGVNVVLLAPKRDQVFPLYRRARRINKETGIPLESIFLIEGTHGSLVDYAHRTAARIASVLQAYT